MSETATTQTTSPTSGPSKNENRSTTPTSSAFTQHIQSGWADAGRQLPETREAAGRAAERRAALSALHPGARIVVPAGPRKQRSNDTDYAYRAHPDFAYLTGWGSDAEPDAVLVMEPIDDGHESTLYFRQPAGRGTAEFYANPEIGEFWIGPRPSLEHVAADLAVATRDLADLDGVLDAAMQDSASLLLAAEADEAITARVGDRANAAHDGLDVVARDLAELRLVKHEWEVAELQRAVDATQAGFEDVIADLAEAREHPRGERIIEGTFGRRARIDGNAVGYDTIAASGSHACILHWTRNDGAVRDGDLVLIDAGVEVDSLYTADITRTLPTNGSFTEVQRRVYEAVLEAADAAFAIVKPGIRFRDVHAAAMQVIARKTAEWGVLPVSAEESLEPEHQFHRRWMVHGTSHHLGLDVHDCAKARRELYHDGVVHEGMVFTIEPGLYFQPDDLTVPEELRGIGVRIEDDIVVTSDGARSLSAGIPRTADEVEAWMREVAAR